MSNGVINDIDPLVHYRHIYQNAECLFTQDQVNAAIARMADEICGELQLRNPLVLCVMNGGVVLMGKLLPRLDFMLQVDYLHASRYRGQTEGDVLHWMRKPEIAVRDRTVLLVDDILDIGTTLAEVIRWCKSEGARDVYTAVLTEKLHDRRNPPDLKADFVGLPLPDRYVFGYGMDYKDYLRNAPGIFAVNEDDLK
jgi:hypoxanthine phosphoribosyltransferase